MKSRWLVRILALLSTLALCLPAALSEEVGEIGEVDLYDPSIYIEDGEPVPEPEPEAAPEATSDAEAEQACELVVEMEAAAEEPAVEPEEPAADPEPADEGVAPADEGTEPAEGLEDGSEREAVEPADESPLEPEPTPEPLLADADAEVAPAAVAADLRMGLGEQYPLDGAA